MPNTESVRRIAGRIMPLHKKNYNPDAVYMHSDYVTHENALWVCLQNGTVGITPSLENPDCWHLIISSQISNAASLGGKTAEEWEQKIANILDGTTPAGDADKFGGKDPEQYAGSDHTHAVGEIEDFPEAMPPTEHGHSVSDINDFPEAMPPTEHGHSVSDINDFPEAMPPTEHGHSVSDINDFPETMPPSEHQHSASDITGGTFQGDVVAAASTDFATPHVANTVILDAKPTVGADAPYPIGTYVRVKK